MANGDITPGRVRAMARDIIIDGTAAFSRGEQVKIEKIEPNLQRPEYKYVVFSQNLQKYFQLSDADLVLPPPPATPPSALPAMPPAGAKDGRNLGDAGRGFSTKGKALVIAAGTVILIIIAVGAVIGLKGGKSKSTTSRPNTPSTTTEPVKTGDYFITLEIYSGQQINVGPAAVRGSVKSDCSLTLDGQPVAIDPATKKFDVVVNINEGPNTLTFSIKDTSSGKTYAKSVPVTGVLSP